MSEQLLHHRQPRKLGRPSKGNRDRVTIRVPIAVKDWLFAEADAKGTTVNDLLLDLVWERCPIPSDPGDEAMPRSA